MNKISPLVIIFYCDTDIVHTSYVAAGLKALEIDGIIKLKYKIGTGKAKGRNGLLFSQCIEIPKENRIIVFDMHDESDYFFPDFIENKDIEYYKTNYLVKQANNLPQKINPFVPYFPINYDKIHWKQILGFFLIVYGKKKAQNMPFFKNLIQSLRQTISRLKRLNERGNIADYFISEHSKKGILYTPGCWPEKDDFQFRVNVERYALIKLLKYNFPTIFKGGFPANKTAISKYHDALYSKQESHQHYIKNIQSAKVNIYTSGLNNCISWRLGELISTGSFIVGPKLPYKFLDNLILNNYMVVETNEPDEYVKKCIELINRNKNSSIEHAKLLNPKSVLKKIIFNP